MESLPLHLQRLDEMLLDLGDNTEAMLLSELDGFLAGLIVSPDPVPPSEWLKLIWGGENDGAASHFQEVADFQAFLDLVMRHHYEIIRALERRSRYAPIFEVDARHDETLWETWISGFSRAVQLRPQGWVRIAESDDEDAIHAWSGLMLLNQVDLGIDDLTDEETDALDEEAEDLIPMWIETLHAWRRRRDSGGPLLSSVPAGRTKVGRNEPCPCGSGKKWKKCCGLN